MLSPDLWTWPSTNCNDIPLVDPAAVSFQGTTVLFARQAATPAAQLYYNVRRPGSESDSPSEWVGWNPLPMNGPDRSDSQHQPTADELPLLRLSGMDLLTVDSAATTADPADAPFRVVSGGRTISCIRQSRRGSLYVDRFVLVQVPAADPRDTSGTAGAWLLRRVWEVRYRRSGLRDVPAGPRDTLDARNLLGQPFLEPTVELPTPAGLEPGAFDVVLAPMADAERLRWHVLAVIGSTLTCLSYPQDSTGRFDLTPGTTRSFTINPAVHQTTGGQVPLTPTRGVAAAVYEEQESVVTVDGNEAGLRRASRLMIALPVQNTGAGLDAAMAIYDFTIQPDGTLPGYPAGAACTVLDGTLGGGRFTPLPGSPDYEVPDGAVLAAGTGTVTSILLGQPQPAGPPALVDCADGLVHCYFAGPPVVAGEPGPFLVVQHDPTVTRVQAAVPWTLGTTTGTFALAGTRPGTSLNGLSVAVVDCPGQPDLCTLTVEYGAASGLPTETWDGVPRDVLTMVSILNGASSGDAADPAVLSGSVPFYDLSGELTMVRLPLDGADPTQCLTVISHRPHVTLASASVAAASAGTTMLTLNYRLDSGQTVKQSWPAVPADTAHLVPVLSGAAADYDYPVTGTPVYGLATDRGSILLFGARPQPVTIGVTPASDAKPAHCDVIVTSGTSEPIKLTNIKRDQGALVKALRASGPLAQVFTYVSEDPVAGVVTDQEVAGPLDLRSGSLLFKVVAPTSAGSLTAVSESPAIVQGRTFASDPPAGAPEGRGLLALAAVEPTVPLFGARPVVQNGSCPITAAGRNGRWLVARPCSALSFDEHNAMVVSNPGPTLAPSRGWTIEAWACPTDGTPSRIVAYNGDAPPPLGGIVPSYFLGTVGQPALQYQAFTPADPYAGSYVHVEADPAFAVQSGRGLTWEAWVRPEPVPCPAGGEHRLGCILQAQDRRLPPPPSGSSGWITTATCASASAPATRETRPRPT